MKYKVSIILFGLTLLLVLSACANQSIWADETSAAAESQESALGGTEESDGVEETSELPLPTESGYAADENPPDTPDPEATVSADLYEDIKETEAGKNVLTIGAMYQRGDLESLVSKFNAASDSYVAQIELYENTTALNTRILEGDGPDVLLLENGDYLSYVTKNILLDVGDILDGATDYEPVIRESIQSQFSDQCAIVSFHYDCVSAPEYVLQGRTSWTFSEFMELAEETNCYGKYSKEEVLLLYCSANLGSFLDTENHTCNFECAEFYTAMEWMNRFLTDDSQIVSDGKASDINFTHQIVSISSLDTTFNDETFWGGSPTTCLGFPSDTDSGLYVIPNLIFGIPYSAQQPDGAREFLTYALSEDYQAQLQSAIPVLHTVLMDSIESWFSTGDYADDPDIADTMVAKMTDILDRTTGIAYEDSKVYEIVCEEVPSYFNGDKTAEEVAHLIQSRVQIYLDEQS